MTCADLLEDEDPETEVCSELGCVVLRDLVRLTGLGNRPRALSHSFHSSAAFGAVSQGSGIYISQGYVHMIQQE